MMAFDTSTPAQNDLMGFGGTTANVSANSPASIQLPTAHPQMPQSGMHGSMQIQQSMVLQPQRNGAVGGGALQDISSQMNIQQNAIASNADILEMFKGSARDSMETIRAGKVATNAHTIRQKPPPKAPVIDPFAGF
jgi:hypothetical protein